MTTKKKKSLNPVDRLVASMEKRLDTYHKNKNRITAEYTSAMMVQNQKIADVLLQIKALKK